MSSGFPFGSTSHVRRMRSSIVSANHTRYFISHVIWPRTAVIFQVVSIAIRFQSRPTN